MGSFEQYQRPAEEFSNYPTAGLREPGVRRDRSDKCIICYSLRNEMRSSCIRYFMYIDS